MNNVERITRRPWLKNYEPDVPASLDYPKINLVEMFERAVTTYPDNPFIHFGTTTTSFHDVGQDVSRLSAAMTDLGLEKGQRVALLLPNIPAFIVAYFAALKSGAVVVAMNPNYKQPEFDFLFRDASPQLAICLESHTGILERLGFPAQKIILVRNGVEESGLAPKPVSGEGYLHYEVLKDTVVDTSSLKYPTISPDDPAIFQYSGGTTGTPKAAIGSHRNIVANVTQFMVWCGLQAGQETILGVIPLYHVYGMVLTMHLALAAGGQLVLVDDPTDTERILREIETRQVSFYPGVPAMFYAITQNPKVQSGDFNIHSIKACISGSAPLHPSIKADFERMTGGKLVEGYGLSEAPTATHCNPVNGCNKAGSIGLPLPDVECRVVDLHKGIREMPHGEPGELILKGPQVMSGYHHQPKEEKIALRDGWLYTGDVVKMDADGYFFIVDRKKSLIKVSGFQVWPSEVERVIVSHPDVENCAVGGVPDLKQGEMVIAWVVRKTNKKLNEEDVRGWCQQRLASYKIPSVILFRENLPKSGVGKVLRRELIAEYIEKEAS